MDKKMYHRIIIALLTLFLIGSSLTVQAKEIPSNDALQKLDDLSQNVFLLTKQGKYAEAKRLLDQLASTYTQFGTGEKISIEALQLSTNTLVQGKRAFASIRTTQDELLWHAYQIRLMIDALTHPMQPIWKSYHSTYIEQISKMIHIASRKEGSGLEKAFQENMKLYSVLKPAFAMHQSAQTIEMMDSLYSFLVKETHQKNPNWKAMEGSLEQLREVADGVFMGKDMNTFSRYFSKNSPLTMIGLMASILLTVLTYAGWKMYRGSRYNV